MIPRNEPPDGPGRKAEQKLWRALKDGLPDDWFVYWSFEYLDDSGREGEVDFLLLHREHGLLCIECKGKGVRRDGFGQWWRRDDDGDMPMKRSPYKQARENQHDLVDQLEERWQKLANTGAQRLPLIFGYAVAFPDARFDEDNLRPADVPEAIVFDSRHLVDPLSWVRGAVSCWRKAARKAPEPFSSREFKRFRKSVVFPIVGIVECLGSRLDADEAALVRVSRDQLQAMQHLIAQPRMHVTGGAGTGKTVLAIETARRFAERGADVLFVCFNKALAGGLRKRLRDEATAGSIIVQHFHSICWHESKRVHGEPFTVPKDKAEKQRFWLEAAPNYVLESIVAEKARRFDAIVVDEAQDFLPSWWVVLLELLRDQKTGRLAVFGDAEQDIFGRGQAGLPPMPVFNLTINYRNTKAIAAVVSRLGRNNNEAWRHSPDGIEPTSHGMRRPAKDVQAVSELVQRLVKNDRITPDRIVVLTPHSKKNSSFKSVESFGPIALSDDPFERSGAVLHTTLSGFKGLESDVVILADIDLEDPRANRRARYVATSRARHILHVWSNGDWQDPDV